jgi:hypothetical protein
MHDALRVRGLERVRHLDRQIEERADLHRMPREPGRERLAVDELHHDERLAVGLLDRVHGADARMVEGRGRSRLPLEPLQHRRVFASSDDRNFTATLRPRRVSSASYTTPMPPTPSWRTMR